MRRTISLASALVVIAVGPVAALTADPQIASLANSGANRTGAVTGSALSVDGRWAAFTSSDDLTGASAGGVRQLYVRDRLSGATLLASANTNGIAAAAPGVDDPGYAISGDGRFVVFASGAANLVAGDADGVDRDVFRKDLRTGAIVVVSRAAGGTQANGPVGGDPDVSFDGARVAYVTGAATNLWAGDASSASDVVVRDLIMDASVLASVAPAGGPLSGTLSNPAISADGRVVAFQDDAAIAVRDLGAATTTVVAPTGARPALSGDGRVVVLQTGAGVTRHDRSAGASSLVTATGAAPVVSADGARVAFETTDAARGDANGVTDVYAWTLGGSVQRVSERAGGGEVAQPSTRPAIGADGSAVAFDNRDSGVGQTLSAADTDGALDVLTAGLPATDTVGPDIAVVGPVDGASVASASIGVSGQVADPSGIVAVTVNGAPVVLGASNAFAAELPLAVGASTITVRALDGAGRSSERRLAVTRPAAQATSAAAKARARLLRVWRSGRATRARFVLDRGANRVLVRVWRRVARVGQGPTWTPATKLKAIGVVPGRRTAIVSAAPLRPGIYQVRVTVISPGGTAVAVMRHVVARRTQPR